MTAQEGTFLIHSRMHPPDGCRRIAPILARIGDKWSVLIIILFGDGPMRFNELRRKIGGVSQRMLTLTVRGSVRGLERDGFLKRTVFPTIPPRVDYELTPLGRSLLQPIQQLGMWATNNVDVIEDAQRRYDKAAGRHTKEPAARESSK
jgi:DNA-binding HxlR family transcriptional regulator